MTDGKANMADQPDNIAEAVAQLTVGNKTREEIMQEVRDRGWIDTTASAPSEFEAGSDWTAQARVYQYQDEYGDVQPRDLNLEKDLYESKFQMRQGEHLANLDFMVRLEGPTRVPPMRSVRPLFPFMTPRPSLNHFCHCHSPSLPSNNPSLLTRTDFLAVRDRRTPPSGP